MIGAMVCGVVFVLIFGLPTLWSDWRLMAKR